MRSRYYVFGLGAVLALFLVASAWSRRPVVASGVAAAASPATACGAPWGVVPSPNAGALYSVAGVASNDVWAVGYDTTIPFRKSRSLLPVEHSIPSGNDSFSLPIEHWNGSVWTAVPAPNPGIYNSGLSSVAAVTSNDVWAVGS